jgi:hypothetical protein
MAANIYRNTLTGLSSTNGFPVYFPDLQETPFSVSVSASPASSASAGFTVEHSFDYLGPQSSVWISSNAVWFPSSGIAAISSNSYTAYTYPVTAIRLNSTGGSSTNVVTFTIVQAG